MTVASTTSRKTFTGNGSTTSFATTPIVFFATGDLTVYVVTTATGASETLTENTHYTVSGGDGAVGTVDLTGGSLPYGAPASTKTLVIVRELDLVQEADPENNDGSDADVAEDVYDKLTMMLQQLSAKIARTLGLADSDVSGASVVLPTPAADKLLGWNGAGTAITNYAQSSITASIVPTAYMETLLDDGTAEAARATLGVVSVDGNDETNQVIYGSVAKSYDTQYSNTSNLVLAGNGTAAPNGNVDLVRFSTDTASANLTFVKGRGTTAAGTIVASGDALGAIAFAGAISATGTSQFASITAAVDGTPGAVTDAPGRLIFNTTPDGSGTLTQRMRINNAGNILTGTLTAAATGYTAAGDITLPVGGLIRSQSTPKARCNWDATTAIIGAQNVTSLTDNATGDTTLNLTNVLGSATLIAAHGMAGRGTAGTTAHYMTGPTTDAPTTSTFRVICKQDNTTAVDAEYQSVTIFGSGV